MSKLNYIVLFAIAEALIVFIFWVVKNHKDASAGRVRKLLLVSLLPMSSYMMTIILTDRTGIRFFYSLYFASMSLLCAELLSFVLDYTGYRKLLAQSKWHYLIWGIVGVDMVSQMLNFLFGHAVSYEDMYYQGELYLEPNGKWPFSVHVFFCYCMLLAVVGVLIYKFFTDVNIYRRQYMVVLVALGLLVGVNAIFLETRLYLDISIIGYGVLASVLAYYTVFFMPRNINYEMGNLLIEQMSAALLLFNKHGDLIRENQQAITLFSQHQRDLKKLMELFKVDPQVESDEHYYRFENEKGEPRIYKASHKRLYGKSFGGKNVVLGIYFIIYDVTEQERQKEENRYRANHDAVTGLYNQSCFLSHVRTLLDEKPDQLFSIAVFHINQFQRILNLFGEAKTDEIMQALAQYLECRVTSSETIYGRYDSSTFIVCGRRALVNTNVAAALEKEYISVVEQINAMIFCGIYHISHPKDEVKQMVAKAKMAAGLASSGQGRAKTVIYDDKIRKEMLFEASMIDWFASAIHNGEFHIYIQPQVNSQTGALTGGEVLTRWIHEETFISPGDFIPVLEKNGLITILDEFIWEQSFIYAKQLQNMGHPVALSVNISPVDLLSCDIYGIFIRLLHKYDLPAKYIRLEITETAMATDIEHMIVLIEKLKATGFVVEMDDFGSAYSSLNALKNIPVDLIKLDMKFFDFTEKVEEKSKNIIAGILDLAKRLNLSVIAEGVEKQSQSDFLASLGCCNIQGFLYGRPMPKEDFTKLANEREFQDVMSESEKNESALSFGERRN